jgi:hypothetical protein
MVYLTQNKKPISGPLIKYATMGMVIQPVKVDGHGPGYVVALPGRFFIFSISQ